MKKKRSQSGLIGVGVDCEDVRRFDALVNKKNIVSKILTSNELETYKTRGDCKRHYLAGRFVAKEAVIKALSGICSNLDMRNIDIKSSKNKPPRVSIEHPFFEKKDIIIDLSISHCNLIATAFCIAQFKTF